MKTATKPYPEIEPFAEETEMPTASPQLSSVERLRLWWAHRRFMSLAAVAGLVIGAALALLLPQSFESTTQLMPPDSQSGAGMALLAGLMGKGGIGSLGAVAGDMLGMKSSGAVFVGILRSRTVEDRLIDRFDLQKVYWKRTKEEARKRLDRKTDISEDRKSGIITVTVTDASPARAAAMAQAYVEELDRLVGQLSTSAAHRQRVFLEQRLDEVNRDLESAEKEFSQFASSNTAIDIKEQGKAMMGAAAELQGQVIATQSELEGLRQIYTNNNVRVRAAEARIAELQSQLRKLGGAEISDQSGTEEKSSSLYPSIRKLPLLGVKYADLYRRTKVDEVVFEALTQQYEMAKVEEAKDTPSVKVLDVAQVPEKRSFPPRLLIALLCTLVAIIGAALLIEANARWEETDTQHPGKIFAQEILHSVHASMPWAAPNGSRFHSLAHRYWIRFARPRISKEVEKSH